MTPNNPFANHYKTITITELLEIIENPDNYQPVAVEAAKKEMQNRSPSETEMADAKEYFILEELQKEKRRAFEMKSKTLAINFVEGINSIHLSLPAIDKQIHIVSAGYALAFIFNFISDIRYFPSFFMDMGRWPLPSILFFEGHLILLLAVFFFWQKTAIGWQLLMFYVINTLCARIWLTYTMLSVKPYYNFLNQKIFPNPALHTLIFQLLILGGTIYFLCKPDIREIYKIGNKKLRNTIAFSIALTILILLFV